MSEDITTVDAGDESASPASKMTLDATLTNEPREGVTLLGDGQPDLSSDEQVTGYPTDDTEVDWGDNGQPTPEMGQFVRTKSKVCIVGFADGHREQAPWDDPDMEFWGLNRLWSVLPGKRWDRWFEVHELDRYYGQDLEHQKWLRESRIPVYVRGQDLPTAFGWGIETAIPYPRDDIIRMFLPYFTNSVSWLLAMAIAMGFEEIHIYGVDMAQDSVTQAEYRQQRPSCEWLIGIAQGAGIKVVIPPGSDLLKTSHQYGFDDDRYRQKLVARMEFLGSRKEQMRGEMNKHQQQASWFQARLSELDGAMQEVQYNLTNQVTRAPQEE